MAKQVFAIIIYSSKKNCTVIANVIATNFSTDLMNVVCNPVYNIGLYTYKRSTKKFIIMDKNN